MELELKVGLQVRASLSYLKLDTIPTVDHLYNTPSIVGQFVERSTSWMLIWKTANTRWLNEASFFYCEGLKWERHVSMVSLIYDQEAFKSTPFFIVSLFCVLSAELLPSPKGYT